MKDDKEQRDYSPAYQLSFTLPFITIGSEYLSSWTEDDLKSFEKLAFSAAEEISADTVPKNSPAGEYRNRIYDQIKQDLRKSIKLFEGAKQDTIEHGVYLICDWVLFQLGWLENSEQHEPFQQLPVKLQSKIEAIAKQYDEDNRSDFDYNCYKMYLAVYKVYPEITRKSRIQRTKKLLSGESARIFESATDNKVMAWEMWLDSSLR